MKELTDFLQRNWVDVKYLIQLWIFVWGLGMCFYSIATGISNKRKDG